LGERGLPRERGLKHLLERRKNARKKEKVDCRGVNLPDVRRGGTGQENRRGLIGGVVGQSAVVVKSGGDLGGDDVMCRKKRVLGREERLAGRG